MPNQPTHIEIRVFIQMRVRLANGRDPLTGQIRQVTGAVKVCGDRCLDQDGREVTLNERGMWVYA